MVDEIEKENSLNQEEDLSENLDEKSEEETDETQEEKETQETKPEPSKEEITDRERRLYARLKKAEEEKKALKEKLSTSTSDVDAILEVQQAVKDLDADEIAELKLRAKALGVSLLEARKDENFVLWKDARRKKVEDEKKTPEPSNKPSITEKPLTEITPQDLRKMSDEEREEYYTKIGWMKPKRGK